MWQFIKQFLRSPQKTGSVMASSEALAEAMTPSDVLANAQSIVEFGPGTGVLTEKILQKIKPGTVFFALEINPDFVKETQKRCPTALVYADSAAEVQKYLAKHQLQNCDVIISALPWTLFSESEQQKILQAAWEALRPGGTFLTFAYLYGMVFPSARRFRKLLRHQFREVHILPPIWANLPAAFVYKCHK